MPLEFIPLLQVQRDLYAMPRGIERFREYIKTMTDAETGDLALPLVAMNPMGKDHIPALLEEYLAMGADQIAADAVASVGASVGGSVGGSEDPPLLAVTSEAERRGGSSEPPGFKICLVVSDDLKGGWTNRYASEFSHRIEGAAITKRGWLTGILWTSEPASERAVREAVLTSIYRAKYLQTHPAPVTLGEMLAQEGYAMARAGCEGPGLDPDDLAYTRSVIDLHLDATDRATVIACLFGDSGANALGYPPQGLSDRAGLALALHDAS